MRRVRARDAMAGGTLPGLSGFEPGETDDAVYLRVRGGEIAARVSAGTPDQGACSAASVIKAVVRLENERVLTFQIHAGSRKAAFRDEAAHLHEHVAPIAGEGPRTAAEVMSRDIVTASSDMLVEDVAKLLAFHNISGMPVEDWDGTVIGVVSEVDVVDKVGDTIGDVMTPTVISVNESTPIHEIAALMANRHIRRVPVLDNGALVGLVTRADIVRALAARAGTPV